MKIMVPNSQNSDSIWYGLMKEDITILLYWKKMCFYFGKYKNME